MKFISTVILLFIVASTSAQTSNDRAEMQTLFGNKSGIGGFIGLESKFTKLNSEHSILTGGGINMVVNQSVNLGFEGYGLVTPVLGNRLDTLGNQYNMYMGYGGLNVEPVVMSNNLIHITFPVLLGVGGIGYSDVHFWEEGPDGDIVFHSDTDVKSGRVFLIAEPGADIELNVFRWMRFTAGASYRFTEQLDSDNLPKEDIDGLSFNAGIRFGWF